MLDVDHPGFHDPEYRQRRDQIAEAARRYRPPGALPRVVYTEAEHGVWAGVNSMLEPLHTERACSMYRAAVPISNLNRRTIPQLGDVSRRIERSTGFRLTPVEGLVSTRYFLEALAVGHMLCTQYIRHHSVPLYTPEPDVVHELLGHVVMFFDQDYCDLNREIGEAARVLSDDSLGHLERLYWYSVEFGLVQEQGVTKAFGAGLLSSAGELSGIESVSHVPFASETITQTPYDTTRMQRVLFTADSQHHMFSEIRRCIGDMRRRECV